MCGVAPPPFVNRACAEYLKTLQYVDLHGLRRQFDTVVRRRVQRNESVIYNEYEIGDATYDDKSRQRVGCIDSPLGLRLWECIWDSRRARAAEHVP